MPGARRASTGSSAECSLSTGSSRRAGSRAITSSPPTTSVSLFASATSMPAPSAASVGTRPAAPTRAFSTMSQLGLGDQLDEPLGARQDRSVRPLLGGARRGGLVGERDSLDVESCAPARPGPFHEVRAASPTTSISRLRSTTSSACTPIDPVDPRMRTLRTPPVCQAAFGRMFQFAPRRGKGYFAKPTVPSPSPPPEEARGCQLCLIGPGCCCARRRLLTRP